MSKVGIASLNFYGIFKSRFSNLELVKPTLEDVDKFDLIVFPGGEDIDFKIYREDSDLEFPHFNTYRDYRELVILYYSFFLRKKIYGSCRGHQLINAVLGGRMCEDMYSSGFGHSHEHEIFWNNSNELQEYIPNRVNSLHHQAVLNCGMTMNSLANYNGVSEVSANNSIITTQFHPELMSNTDSFFRYLEDWANKKRPPLQYSMSGYSEYVFNTIKVVFTRNHLEGKVTNPEEIKIRSVGETQQIPSRKHLRRVTVEDTQSSISTNATVFGSTPSIDFGQFWVGHPSDNDEEEDHS